MFAVRDVRGSLKGFSCNYLGREKPDETDRINVLSNTKINERDTRTVCRSDRLEYRTDLLLLKTNLVNYTEDVNNALNGSDEKKA